MSSEWLTELMATMDVKPQRGQPRAGTVERCARIVEQQRGQDTPAALEGPALCDGCHGRDPSASRLTACSAFQLYVTGASDVR